MYKVGDKLLCKRNGSFKGDDSRPYLKKGELYEIEKVDKFAHVYYYINNFVFMGEKIEKGGGGLGPSADINYYFYTKQELRKMKLKNLNNEKR